MGFKGFNIETIDELGVVLNKIKSAKILLLFHLDLYTFIFECKGWAVPEGVLDQGYPISNHRKTVLYLCTCVLSCGGSGFATGWSPVQKVLSTL
jgi:hypothetical protein